jgi:hypothetical protein
MDKQERIQNSLRDCLSIVLGRVKSLDHAEFTKRFQLLVDAAAARSAAVLGPETVRYQGILLYASLILVSVALFAVRTIKIGDAAISVDRRLLLFYAVFIAMISIVFAVKAYVDYKRASSFAGITTAAATGEAQHLVQIALLKRRIQSYYFLEFFDAVAKAYHRYSNADAKLTGGKEPDPPSSMNALLLDRLAFGQDLELAAELDRQERLYGPLNAELAADVEQFGQAALIIASSSSAQTDDEYQPYEEGPRGRLRKAFVEWLRPWLDARSQISDEHTDAVLANGDDSPELKRLNAINYVLAKAKRIQRVYVVLEIVAPLVFALAAIVYAYSLG